MKLQLKKGFSLDLALALGMFQPVVILELETQAEVLTFRLW